MGTQSCRSEARALESIAIPLETPLRGRLIRRYKRFLADIETESGEVLTVHCPNPGAMTGTDRPGSAVCCSTSDNPKRKFRHTLEMIRVGRIWVGLQPLRANQLIGRALRADAIPELAGYGDVRPEAPAPGGSRLDFKLSKHGGDTRPAWVEVKSVTLAERDTARFPDAITRRGLRHLETLMTLKARQERAVLLFVVQRGDCARVEAAEEIDPDYARALRAAARKGVEILALGARVRTHEIRLERVLPVVC